MIEENLSAQYGKIISIDQLNFDIYRIKEQWASTYIDLPENCKNLYEVSLIYRTLCDDEWLK